MQNKLFIGNLSFKLSEDDIRELFEKYGTITEIAIPVNRENQKPRGFAFITFEGEDSAKKALALDGQEVDGRKIRVSIATGEKRNYIALCINFLLTIVLVGNVMFYDFYSDFVTLPVLGQTSNFGQLGGSIIEILNYKIILAFVDIIFFFILLFAQLSLLF